MRKDVVVPKVAVMLGGFTLMPPGSLPWRPGLAGGPSVDREYWTGLEALFAGQGSSGPDESNGGVEVGEGGVGVSSAWGCVTASNQ